MGGREGSRPSCGRKVGYGLGGEVVDGRGKKGGENISMSGTGGEVGRKEGGCHLDKSFGGTIADRTKDWERADFEIGGGEE